jgi:chromosome segregation ATPase
VLVDQLCNYFRHADAAKLESTLEGVKKGHAIAMEGLQAQIQKSLTENTCLEEQLKDQERQNRQKQKEVDDLRQAAINFEDQQRGFTEVLDHFQKTLLGNLGSPCFAVCADILYWL